MARNIQWYGWHPDLPDHRDIKYKVAPHIIKALPPRVDLSISPNMPAVYNQGSIGSCTAHAACAAYQFDQNSESTVAHWNQMPSRLFQYYNTRLIEGSTSSDSGGQIRDAVKALVQYGACPASSWPYVTKKFAVKPPASAYTIAAQHKAIQYQSLSQTLGDIKGALASGHPVQFGFTVYDSFESQAVATSGIVNLPAAGEQVVGGHAVLIVGYDDRTMRFIVRNSWGADWGMKGYFTMPYAYIINPNLSSDFWIITTVS